MTTLEARGAEQGGSHASYCVAYTYMIYIENQLYPERPSDVASIMLLSKLAYYVAQLVRCTRCIHFVPTPMPCVPVDARSISFFRHERNPKVNLIASFTNTHAFRSPTTPNGFRLSKHVSSFKTGFSTIGWERRHGPVHSPAASPPAPN